jgi:hypothetical protein
MVCSLLVSSPMLAAFDDREKEVLDVQHKIDPLRYIENPKKKLQYVHTVLYCTFTTKNTSSGCQIVLDPLQQYFFKPRRQ